MKELVVSLPDDTYEQLVTNATLAHKSPEQWAVEKLSSELKTEFLPAALNSLLSTAMDTLGFRRLEHEKAERLSTLLQARKARDLSENEAIELRTLIAEAEALELTSLQRLAATLTH